MGDKNHILRDKGTKYKVTKYKVQRVKQKQKKYTKKLAHLRINV